MDIEGLIAFAKSKGLFWPSAEMYGGLAGFYDYGHLGALLKRRFESLWISYFIDSHENYHLVDGTTIFPEKPLIASGHVERFNDVVIGCTKCATYYRADVLLNELKIEVAEGISAEEVDKVVKARAVRCPNCKGSLLPAKQFNMMIDVHLGPDKKDKGYLRPETAQTPYLNFAREFNILRKSFPMGLATIGKAYRNEISPRQGLYRMRELTQAELQIFFDPDRFETDFEKVKDTEINVVPYETGKQVRMALHRLVKDYGIPEFYAYHLALIDQFYRKAIGLPEEKLRFFEKGGVDKAFYNKVHMDIEVNVESWGGFKEVGGLHYRGDYDLSSHSKGSGQDLSITIEGKKIMPNVLELSFGVDRNIWMLIDAFYVKEGDRKILKLAPWLSPYSVAVFPLQKDEAINETVAGIYKDLKGRFKVYLDDAGSIGRRYARMDDVGTPFCVTVDFESVDSKSPNHGTVTVRERDTKAQDRIRVEKLAEFLAPRLIFE